MNGQTTLSELPVSSLTRELDSRTSDGMHVRLLWTPWTNQVHVSVVDWRRSTALHFEVAPADARDAFHHPFAFAPNEQHDLALAA
jgi:hypothetical protein